MQPSTDRRRGNPATAASRGVWRPRSAGEPTPTAADPRPIPTYVPPHRHDNAAPHHHDNATPILPLPNPASDARRHHRRQRRPNLNDHHTPPQERAPANHNNSSRHRRPPPQERDPLAPTNAPAPAGPPAPAAGAEGNGSVPQLVQEIQDKLARGAVECMICYDMLRRSAPVWSCGSCFSIFHLPCIRKWARSPASVSDASDPAASWRCPGCQSVHDVPARDIAYTCFCTRRRDPPNDLFLTPPLCFPLPPLLRSSLSLKSTSTGLELGRLPCARSIASRTSTETALRVAREHRRVPR